MNEKELRKIISEVLHENPRVMYIPDLAPYLLEKLDNACYGKIPEGSVVLSMEEYEKLKQDETYRLLYGRSLTAKRKDDYDLARKITAKEILQGFYDLLELITDNNSAKALLHHIEQERTEYGVEVEE